MSLKKSLLLASLGTFIEYYDYSIFTLFLPFLAPTFFVGHSEYDSLIMGFYAILIASIARPIGGIVFGIIGDKFGRKVSLLCSLYGIAIATLLIGVLPGYASIGVYAIIILIGIRAVQMLCFGGEYSGAGIYVVEIAREKNISFIGAILTAMALIGSVGASLVGMGLTALNPIHPNWRLAFIIGGIIGLITIFFRQGMSESVSGHDLNQHINLSAIFTNYRRQMFAGVCIGGFATLPFTTVLAFINPVLKTKNYLTSFEFMLLQFSLSIIAVLVLLSSGFIADRISPHKVMRQASICLIVLAIPLSLMLQSMLIKWVIVAEISLVVINEFLLGPSNAYLKQLFPVQCRYRGVAFSFCLGMSLVGGLTPVIENFLYQTTGYMASIAIWLIFVSLMTYISLQITKQDAKF
ncbi:MAG: hypothetical protein RLZZ293_349 [Pseudomonadota bacterium]|jgi:MHS family proline/betaine transporter-like MFS transporter